MSEEHQQTSGMLATVVCETKKIFDSKIQKRKNLNNKINANMRAFESSKVGIFSMNDTIFDSIEKVYALRCQQMSYAGTNYLNEDSCDVIDSLCRTKMCEWCYQTVDFFKLSRHSVHVAMSCLDRFLSTESGHRYMSSKTLFQLACVTSLYTSVKAHEAVELGVSMMVELCRGAYTVEQILETEEKLLAALKWAVNPPTPQSFVIELVNVLPTCISETQRKEIIETAQHQCDIASANYDLSVNCEPTIVATASIANSLQAHPTVPKSSLPMCFNALDNLTDCGLKLPELNAAMNILWDALEDCEGIPTRCQPVEFLLNLQEGQRCNLREEHLQDSTMTEQHLSPVAILGR